MPTSRLQELLRSFDDRGVAAEFCQYVLGRLVAYDRAHNADLFRTLQVYFRCGGNAVEAAEQLFLHRNSLLYRLQRIETLLGIDLKDPHDRLTANLAVEFAELLQNLPDAEEALR
ncbi:MAG: helix-turn-helix domain-containing protein [Chloroflexota bacterium]